MENRYQSAIDEIKLICIKYGIVLVGTCESESIHGEISIIENNLKNSKWGNVHNAVDNKLYGSIDDGYRVYGIGEINHEQ